MSSPSQRVVIALFADEKGTGDEMKTELKKLKDEFNRLTNSSDRDRAETSQDKAEESKTVSEGMRSVFQSSFHFSDCSISQSPSQSHTNTPRSDSMYPNMTLSANLNFNGVSLWSRSLAFQVLACSNTSSPFPQQLKLPPLTWKKVFSPCPNSSSSDLRLIF